MNLTEEELEALEACQTSQEWGDACDAVKEARNGSYPPDWWDRVKLTGMMDRILGRWGADSKIRSASFKNKKDVIRYLDEDYGFFGEDLFKN